MKTKLDVRSLVLGTLAGAVIVLCLGAATEHADREPAILKLKNEAGRVVALVTLLHGTRVVPKDPLTESPRGYRPDSYQVHGGGVQMLSPSGELLFEIDTAHELCSIVYEPEARVFRNPQTADEVHRQMEVLGAELTELRKRYKDNHPKVQEIMTRMRALAQRQLEQQRK